MRAWPAWDPCGCRLASATSDHDPRLQGVLMSRQLIDVQFKLSGGRECSKSGCGKVSAKVVACVMRFDRMWESEASAYARGSESVISRVN